MSVYFIYCLLQIILLNIFIKLGIPENNNIFLFFCIAVPINFYGKICLKIII